MLIRQCMTPKSLAHRDGKLLRNWCVIEFGCAQAEADVSIISVCVRGIVDTGWGGLKYSQEILGYKYCKTRTYRGKPIKGNTIRHYHAVIHKALQDAVVVLHILQYNVADYVVAPKIDNYVAPYADTDELHELINDLMQSPIRVPVMFAAFYGMRRSEALGIRKAVIDRKKKTITVCHTIIEVNLNSVYTRSGQNSTPNSNATNLHSSQKRCCSFCISSSNASPTFQVQKSIFHQMTKPIQVTVILPLLLAISFSRNDDIHSSISGISNDLIGVIPTIGQ